MGEGKLKTGSFMSKKVDGELVILTKVLSMLTRRKGVLLWNSHLKGTPRYPSNTTKTLMELQWQPLN